LTPVVFSPRSVFDLREIGDWIAQSSPRRAIRFVVELREHAQRIGAAPLGFPSREDLSPGLRMAVHRPYLILFRVSSDHVRIERVLHGARDLRQLLGEDS
jgi:toxin ParE1/3/4